MRSLLFLANAVFSGDSREVLTVDVSTQDYVFKQQQDLTLRDLRFIDMPGAPVPIYALGTIATCWFIERASGNLMPAGWSAPGHERKCTPAGAVQIAT